MSRSCRGSSEHPLAESQPGLVAADDPWAKLRLPGRATRHARAMEYARACWPDGTATEQLLLARHLATIMALDDALETAPPLPTPIEEYQSLLPWHHVPPEAGGGAKGDARAPIRAALVYLETCFAGLAQGQRPPSSAVDAMSRPRPSAIAWWRHHAESMVAAAWQESWWRSGAPLPDEGAYLAIAEVSIAVSWIAASLRLLDGATLAPRAGSLFLAATSAVAAAVRLANDLYDTRRERREGKVQLFFLRARALQALGYAPRYANHRARREVRALLVKRVARARALLDPRLWTGSPRLRSGLEGILCAALALIFVPELQVRGELDRGRVPAAGVEPRQ